MHEVTSIVCMWEKVVTCFCLMIQVALVYSVEVFKGDLTLLTGYVLTETTPLI